MIHVQPSAVCQDYVFQSKLHVIGQLTRVSVGTTLIKAAGIA
jgi:hypothetical protein